MAETYGFFDSNNYDRVYDAKQVAEIIKGIVTNGVFDGIGNNMSVSADSNGIYIDTGRAIIDSHWYEIDTTAKVMSLPALSVTTPALLVLVCDYSTREIYPELMLNTSITDSTNMKYLKLAELNVSSSGADVVKNYIGTSECPLMHDISAITKLEDEVKSKFDGTSREYVPIRYVTKTADFDTDFMITIDDPNKIIFSCPEKMLSINAPFGSAYLPYILIAERIYATTVTQVDFIRYTCIAVEYAGTEYANIVEYQRYYKGSANPIWTNWENISQGSGTGGSVTVDRLLSTTSENPVQNKVITSMLNELKEKINDIESGNGNVAADFLTEEGFGNLRFYNGKFQYYNADTQAWTDCEVTDSNSYILQMVPQVMKRVLGWYDHNAGHYKLLFEEPADTVIDGQVATVVDSVYIVRKLGSLPESVDDADCVQVDVIDRSDFGTHKNKAYVDKSFTPSDGEIWYYKLIPHSTSGFYNNTNVNGTRGLEARDYFLLGYKVDKNDSNPDTRVTYTDDCDGFSPAFMDYGADKFKFGTWEILNPWFISENKPCAVKFDGTVDYYMNPDDYSLRENGTSSDYDNVDYQGNMMAQMPKVYLKRWEDSNFRYCQISDKKVNNDFKCYAHLNANQQELDYIYLPMFKGVIDSNSKLRSYAGAVPTVNMTHTAEYDAAHACGQNWYMLDWSTVALLQDLLVLLGRNTNSQNTFGTGQSTSDAVDNGVLSSKGQFYGTNDYAQSVKIFHSEVAWGVRFERVAGLIMDNGVCKYKMYPDYNITGTGYSSVSSVALTAGFQSSQTYGEWGALPSATNGSITTYECDYLWVVNSGVCSAAWGNSPIKYTLNIYGVGGFFALALNLPITGAWPHIGASVVCKPL